MATRFEPSEWRSSIDYLYGVDLFNYRYWWEAHETWEGIWVAVGRRTAMGQFMQGLIQVSVAHLKGFQGLNASADRLLRKAFTRMARSGGTFLGIEIEIFKRDVEAYFTGTRASAPLIQLVGFSVAPQGQETLRSLNPFRPFCDVRYIRQRIGSGQGP